MKLSENVELTKAQHTDAITLSENLTYLLAADIGYGKTLTALGAWKLRSFPILFVMCPKIMRLEWEKAVHVVKPDAKVKQLEGNKVAYEEGTDVYIMTHQTFVNSPRHFQEIFEDLSPEEAVDATLIIDEAHKLKTPTTARTQSVYNPHYGIASNFYWVWLLTGSPMPNGLPGELYPHLKGLWPTRVEQFKDFREFRHSFHDIDYLTVNHRLVERDVGAVNLDVFKKLIDGIYTRRELKDHLDLDEPIINPFEVRPTPRELAELNHRMDIELGCPTKELSEQKDLFNRLNSQQVASAQRLTGSLKIRTAVSLADEIMRSGGKVLIGCWNHDVMLDIRDGLTCEGQSAYLISGNTSGPDLVSREFEEDEEPCACVMQISVAQGINLQSCHHVIMVQSSWVPEENRQFIGRCHRRGQKNRVIVHWLHIPGSLDESMQKALIRKQHDIEEMIQ